MSAIRLVFFLLVGLPGLVFGQHPFSWINFGQQAYFKIPVAQDGIYRLTYSNLQAAGFPVDRDPRYIQLFHRGQEQLIYVKGEGDGVFNSDDYIEFFGQKNDGTLDSLLYQIPSNQPHKYYNLYSDTTAYFITNGNQNFGLRMDEVKLANTTNIPAETYQFSQRLFVFHDQYSAGLRADNLTNATTFDQGEGWTGTALQQGQTIDYTVDSLLNGVASGGNPKLELLLVGRDFPDHSLDIFVGPNISSLRFIDSAKFSGFETHFLSSDLSWSDIGSDGKLVVRIVARSATTERYQASASYLKVTFSQNFDWGNQTSKSFQLVVKPGRSYLSITNPPANLRMWDVSDIQNITWLQTITSNPNPYNIVVPGGVSRIYSSSVILTPQIIPVSFRDFRNSTANFLIITNKTLQKPGGRYPDPVQAYATYRASVKGGGYDTLIVTVDQLYDQFNYGEVSPLAIYSFMKSITQHPVKYLFLIGKGRDITYSGYARKTVPSTEYRDLVPSAGYPGGDNAFTTGLGGTTYYPLVPTGRLTATTPAQVASYLEKVKELETSPIQPWAKQLLHLSGGESEFDLHQFRQFVDGYKSIAEGQYLGGHVTTQSKSNVEIQKINVSPIVNQGVNLVTFFGHSSSSTIDIDIGYVSDPTLGYNNPGKYPVFLINGCNAGTIFANSVTFSEDWMLAPGKGSRNFIAGTSFGWAGYLNTYSTLFYQVGFGDSTFISKGIGDIQKETSRRYLDSASVDIFSIAQVQQMVLAGDPSLKLFGTTRPDYAIDDGSISLASLDGKPVSSLSDSFALRIIVKNLGAYNPKHVKISVVRTFNDNSSRTYDSTYAPTLYIDTLTFKIKKENDINGFGNNIFIVKIDPQNSIIELNDSTNNINTLNAFIPSNGTINLYPVNYGIADSSSVNLVFQDANLLGIQRNFLVQMDTVSTFNSPFLQQQTVPGKVLAKSHVNLLAGDSIVYYWRTKPVKLTVSDSANWTVSSFIHISGSPEGWAQTKFSQVSNGTLVNLYADENQRKINFLQTVTALYIKSIGSNSPSPYTDASFKIDGYEYNVRAQQEVAACRNNTINLVAFNKETAAPYSPLQVQQDPRICGRYPAVINSFLSTELEAIDGRNILASVGNIQESDSVVLYSVGNPVYSSWSTTVLSTLNDLGIGNTQVTSLTDGEPVIILAKKGSAVGSAKVFRTSQTPPINQDLAINATITGRYISGKIKSPLIGPAKSWGSFSAKAKAVEPVDKVSYSIYGVNLSGQETLLRPGITAGLDLSFVDAAVYPMLRVQINLQDSVNQSASQIRNWFVFYESVAEGLLFYEGSQEMQSVQEGQPFTGNYGFVNISSKAFSDSLQVHSGITTLTKGQTESASFKIKAPAPGDTSKFSLSVNTRGKAGLNDISVFVNPKIQPEQYYENNTINLTEYLNVITDRSSPTLDVTVDNRYLQNGDYVSTNPLIQAKLHDDNPFLFVTDTTHLTIFLSYPCAETPCPFQRISFLRTDVHWSPASANNDFTFSFHPENLASGNYTLQVAATDASGNASGARPYEVDFKVKTETTLTFNSVYPNPSSDGFNFSFDLSGNELPDAFSLQLFSREGQLLQQFGLDEVSNFIIGNNSIYWSSAKSGLGNGLIVYRLTITANGKTASQSGRLLLMK